MNLETLDGFFAALIAGPETAMPSEYYREVFGGEISDTCDFISLDEGNEILGLFMRHWNEIAGTLFKGCPRFKWLFISRRFQVKGPGFHATPCQPVADMFDVLK